MSLSADQIACLFDRCFEDSHRTRCVGGGDEPLYMPGSEARPAQLQFRGDYPASALHEISHWCLAGTARRQQIDFGYHYAPTPRRLVEQVRFLAAEVQPQALERIFADSARVSFRYSFDDIEDRFVQLRPGFRAAVDTAYQQFLKQPLAADKATRAQLFSAALACAA